MIMCIYVYMYICMSTCMVYPCATLTTHEGIELWDCNAMTCWLHATMLSMPRLKLPDFHQVTITHTGNTKCLLDTSQMLVLDTFLHDWLAAQGINAPCQGWADRHNTGGQMIACVHVLGTFFTLSFVCWGTCTLFWGLHVCVCLCACGYPCPIYHSEPCKILKAICSSVHSEQ
jgi:hypothetical protein